MGKYKNWKDYQQARAKRAVELRASKRRTETAATEFFIARVRAGVPRKSGKLALSIRRRRNVVSIGGVSKDGFPYVHWINQTPGTPYKRLVYSKGVYINNRQVIKPGTVAVYGQSPAGWNWTGQARFWEKAKNLTRKYFRSKSVQEFRRAMRSA